MTVHSQGEDFEVAAKSLRSLFSGGPISFPVVQGPILVPQAMGPLTSLVGTPWSRSLKVKPFPQESVTALGSPVHSSHRACPS